MATAVLPAAISVSTVNHRLRQKSPTIRRFSAVRCSFHSIKTLTTVAVSVSVPDPPPIFTSIKTFAPATIANLGPGFDFLGCAVAGIGDTVTISVDPSVPPGTLSIASISSTIPSSICNLSRNPNLNCAGISAIAVMKKLGIRSVGLSLHLHKGLPLGSGLGSSAASAAASAMAVNSLFGCPITLTDLVLAGLESESKVSGYHADNIAPSIMGGFVLIRSYEPLDLIRLEFPLDRELFFVLVIPEFQAPTKKMRAVLPETVSMSDHVSSSSQAAALVAAILRGDAKLLGSAMSSDRIVEPKRSPLIPGMADVKKAAIESGAFGCTISGAGPTAVAIVNDEEIGNEVGRKMAEAFLIGGGLKAVATVARIDRMGARVIDDEHDCLIVR